MCKLQMYLVGKAEEETRGRSCRCGSFQELRRWQPSRCRGGGGELEDTDPVTEELLDRVPLSGSADVDRAVRKAAEVFKEWRDGVKFYTERKAVIKRWPTV